MIKFIKEKLRESLKKINNISSNELQKIQCGGNSSCDNIFDVNDNDIFMLTQIRIKNIIAPKNLFLQYYKQKGLDKDILIVTRIIKALNDNKKIIPFVIDRNNKIMDGLHRFVAHKYYYNDNKIINVYKQKLN